MNSQVTRSSVVAIRLLGGVEVLRDDRAIPLPRSKKTRALLAYLALSTRPRRRDALCAMFWDRPDDPKGALRWSLSKIRPLLAKRDDSCLQTDGDLVRIDMSALSLDVSRLLEQGADPDQWETGEMEQLAAAGDLLAGFELPRCPDFELWLAEQRENVGRARLAILRELCRRHADDSEKALGYARLMADIAPSDADARWQLIDLLFRTGRTGEAERQREIAGDLLAGKPPFSSVVATRAAPMPVTAAPPPSGPAPESADSGIAALDQDPLLPDRPSIAVLPFQSFGANADDQVFAVGLTHDIIMRISRLRWLFVIARGSAFNILTESTDVGDIARRLGVRYVMQGTAAIAGGQLRVDVALVDAASRTEIWVEQYIRDLTDIFAIQQDISDAIVRCLQVEIEEAETKRALQTPTSSLDAWSAYHRGVWHMYQYKPQDIAKAEQFLHRAIELDPTGPRAYAAMSFVEFQKAFVDLDPDHEGALKRALEMAEKSIAADPRDTLGHWALGRALLMFREYDQSIEELETAIELNPNYAGAHFALARTCFTAGLGERGIECSDIARRLSPYDPLRFAMLSVKANCLVQLGRAEEAVDWIVRAARQPNTHHHIIAVAAYCSALAGRDDLAGEYRERLLAARPGYDMEEFLRAFPLREKAHVELVQEGFRKAGLPA